MAKVSSHSSKNDDEQETVHWLIELPVKPTDDELEEIADELRPLHGNLVPVLLGRLRITQGSTRH